LKQIVAGPWDRLDQWASEGLAALVFAAASLAVPAVGVHAALVNSLEVQASLGDGVLAAPRAAGRFALQPVRQTQLLVADPTTSDRLAYAVPGMLLFVLIAVVAWQIVRMLGTLRTGTPFCERNLRRATIVAATVLIGGIGWGLVDAVTIAYFADQTDVAFAGNSPISMVTHIPLLPLGAGLALFAAVEFLRRGAALRDEVDGLV